MTLGRRTLPAPSMMESSSQSISSVDSSLMARSPRNGTPHAYAAAATEVLSISTTVGVPVHDPTIPALVRTLSTVRNRAGSIEWI
jgi:hypothetical protein